MRAMPLRGSRLRIGASLALLAGASGLLSGALDSRLLEPSTSRGRAWAVAPLILVHGRNAPEHRRAAETWAAGAARFLASRPEVVADGDLTLEDRRRATLVLLGRPEVNSVVGELLGRIPARFTPEGFTFGGREYHQPDDVLRLSLSSPWHRQRPLLFVIGARPEPPLVGAALRWAGPRYAIERAGRTLRYGRLRHDRIDPLSDIDLEGERKSWQSVLGQIATPHFEIHFPPASLEESEVRRQAQRLEERFTRARLSLGLEVELCVRQQLYPSIEIKGRQTDSVALAHLDGESRTVHAVLSAEDNGLDQARELAFLLEEALGPPASPHLARGLERLLAEGEDGLSASRLLYQGFEPDLDQLARLPAEIYEPLAAGWVRFLLERLGEERFFDLYRGEGSADLVTLKREWRGQLELESRANLSRFTAEAAASRAAYRSPGWQQGFNYAYSNDRESGYATGRSRRSLGALRRLGANAVALVPYGFTRPFELTEIRRAGTSPFAESDESLRVAVRQARALGLLVQLKPQIWLSAEVWPSNIDFATEADWERWFRSYQDWILPYAVLAEELRVDLFAVGTELTHAALKQPERFRELIARVRRIYHGPLTYAANWHDEFERVSFWDALDVMGLNNYFPLAEDPAAGESELRAGAVEVAERVEAVARREGKRVVFTEVGFPSVRAAGLSAVGGRGLEREPDLKRQALLYEITFRTYWGRPWFSGLYWWKWFSDPANAGPAGDPWTPRGKPAEAVVSAWFRKAPASSATRR
jgi:hypothetical protein